MSLESSLRTETASSRTPVLGDYESPVARRKRVGALKSIAGAALLLLLGILLTILFDRVLGLFVRPSRNVQAESGGLLFPPNTSLTYVMPEARFTAHINSLGFRDREFASLPSKDTIRVIAIGDSYTFGWGVEASDSWPKIVERELKEQGHPVEILNLGAPGANPAAYAAAAERSIPLLHPDLVILGVLSGQDYSQQWWSTQTIRERFQTHAPKEWPGLIWQRLQRVASPLLERLYPNSAALVARARQASLAAAERKSAARPDSTQALGDSRIPQRGEALSIERKLGAKQRSRFEKLDPNILRMFRGGELNPSLVYFAVDRPELYALVDDFESPRGQQVVRSMARDFDRVRAAAERNGARTIILSTPYIAYASQHDCQTMTSFGYTCVPAMYEFNAPDRSTQEAGNLSKIPVYLITQSFRPKAAQGHLYFRYDDHPNRNGYQVLANLFTPIIASALPVRQQSAGVR